MNFEPNKHQNITDQTNEVINLLKSLAERKKSNPEISLQLKIDQGLLEIQKCYNEIQALKAIISQLK